MKKICVLLLYVALCGQICAQTIKTYKGRMSESPVKMVDLFPAPIYEDQGIWSYQYYEDDNSARVYHGRLTFSVGYTALGKYTITGQYSHGKREGAWVWQAIYNNKVVGKYVANYHNDLLDGDFSYQPLDVNMRGSFSNGQLIGTMACTVTEFGRKRYYEAHYSNGGYPVGTWKFDNIHDGIVENIEFQFLNNCLISETKIDQSTGKRRFYKNESDWEKEDNIMPENAVFIPESIANKITENNRGFRNGNTYYTFEEVDYEDYYRIPYIDLDALYGFEEIHKLYLHLGYNPKYLRFVRDNIRNKEVEDSIAEAERQQKEQVRLAEQARQEEEKQRIHEAHQAHLRAVSQTQELADKIEIAYSIRKGAKKWKNVKGLFDIISIHHDDYEDTPENISFLNDYYICVYKIFNSENDNKTRKEFESLIAAGLAEVRDAQTKVGGWRMNCDPDKVISNFIQQAKGLTLIEFNAIPEITEQEKKQFKEDSKKKTERAMKTFNFLNKIY